MEAQVLRCLIVVASFVSLGAGFGGPSGSYRTQNFIIQASSTQFAQQIGDAAEKQRRELAISWLGKELPPWPAPCPIVVQDGNHLGAGGATTYTPTSSGVRDFEMNIQGSRERLLDSVLPHEITHTVLATHFNRPLPRWADEGACTTVEHVSERTRHEGMLRQFLTQNRGIPMNRMFMMRDYPRDILPLYAQGFSVSRFLIEQGGRRKFVDFVGEVLSGSQWTDAVRRNYGYESLAELQQVWLSWVAAGSGPVDAYVKNSGSQIPDPASIAQVAAVTPQNPTTPEATGPSVGSLATARDSGWYVRRRQEIAAQESQELPPPQRSFEKKSLRGHTISRPQPAQGIAPQGVPWASNPPATMWR